MGINYSGECDEIQSLAPGALDPKYQLANQVPSLVQIQKEGVKFTVIMSTRKVEAICS